MTRLTAFLTGTNGPPTPALLAAVMLLAAEPGDVRLAQDAYVRGSLTRMNLDLSTQRRIAAHLPGIAGENDGDMTETEQ